MNQYTKILLFTVAATFACGPEERLSEVKIDSGIHITDLHSNTVPGVMSIGGCTSTAVSDNTLITAAHCVSGSSRICARIDNLGKKACTSEIYYPSRYGGNGYRNYDYDIAVGVFPRGTFQKFFDVASPEESLQVGENVVMVGFSKYSIEGQNSGKGSKRWGSNKVHKLDGNGDVIITKYGFSDESVAVNPGDSGGPMFKGCKLVGVTSRTNGYGTFSGKSSLHTNVQWSPNLTWLRELEVTNDTYYCGLTGDDPIRCPAAGRAEPLENPGQNEFNERQFPCTDSGTPRIPEIIRPEVTELSIALDGPADSGTAYFSAPKSTVEVRFCMGDVINCEESTIPLEVQKAEHEFLNLFSASRLDMTKMGTTFSAFAYDANGILMGSRKFSVQSR